MRTHNGVWQGRVCAIFLFVIIIIITQKSIIHFCGVFNKENSFYRKEKERKIGASSSSVGRESYFSSRWLQFETRIGQLVGGSIPYNQSHSKRATEANTLHREQRLPIAKKGTSIDKQKDKKK